jgi:transposase
MPRQKIDNRPNTRRTTCSTTRSIYPTWTPTTTTTRPAPPAYARAVLKVILFAYSRGIVSCRRIEAACRNHITFIALSGDTAPHFTTLAGFIRALGDDIANLFAQVLLICDAQGLIGREMYAIDGVNLPGNASKHKSGTRAQFEQQAARFRRAGEEDAPATSRQR